MILVRFILIVILSLSLFSCEETEEGCLNKFATNYDVTADDPCDDCCKNQELEINFRLIVDSLGFSLGTAFLTPQNDTIRFQKLDFVVSGFKILTPSNDSLAALNRIGNDSLDIANDFVFIKGSASDNTVIEYQYEGETDSLLFHPGVPELINQAGISFDNNNFQEMRDSLFSESLGSYYILKLEFIDKDSTSFSIELQDIDDKRISFGLDTLIMRGASIKGLNMEFDINTLWEGINIFDDADDISPVLRENFYKSFELN